MQKHLLAIMLPLWISLDSLQFEGLRLSEQQPSQNLFYQTAFLALNSRIFAFNLVWL